MLTRARGRGRRVATAPHPDPPRLAHAAPLPALRGLEPLRPRAPARPLPRLPLPPGARAGLPEPAAPDLDPLALRGRLSRAPRPVLLGPAPRVGRGAPARRVREAAPRLPRDARPQPADARPAGPHAPARARREGLHAAGRGAPPAEDPGPRRRAPRRGGAARPDRPDARLCVSAPGDGDRGDARRTARRRPALHALVQRPHRAPRPLPRAGRGRGGAGGLRRARRLL